MRALLLAASLAFSAPALAQEPPEPNPSSGEWLPPTVVPTLGIHESLSFSRYGLRDPVTGEREPALALGLPAFWIGLTLYPSPGRWAIFTSFGTEIAFGTLFDEDRERRYTEWVPEMRTGIAHMRAPYDSYFNHVFADVQLYFIAGWRIENPVFPEGARLGAGVTAPPLVLLGMAESCLPMPTSFEMYADVAEGELPRWGFRIGFQF